MSVFCSERRDEKFICIIVGDWDFGIVFEDERRMGAKVYLVLDF
jgi:hypothetical protein